MLAYLHTYTHQVSSDQLQQELCDVSGAGAVQGSRCIESSGSLYCMWRPASASQCGVVHFVLLPRQRHLQMRAAWRVCQGTGRSALSSLPSSCWIQLCSAAGSGLTQPFASTQELSCLNGHVEVMPADTGASVQVLGVTQQGERSGQHTRDSCPRLLRPPSHALVSR